jgi:hypothetical protein
MAPTVGAQPRAHRAASTHLLAFVRDSATAPPEVWVSALNGSGARQLFKGDQPLVSPNGAFVAGTSVSSGSVLVYSATGKLLVSDKLHGAYGVLAGWSRDSRYLAVELVTTAVTGVSGAGLEVIDTKTGADKLLTSGVIQGASFTTGGTDKLVYAKSNAKSQSGAFSGPFNLYESAVGGGSQTQLTSNGESLYPVCGAKGIVFVRQTFRGKGSYPAYQLWLLNGSKLTQLTHLTIGKLVDGLIPVSISSSGNRLLANFEGEDTDFAYSVQISPLSVQPVKGFVQGGAISSDGRTLLIDSGGFEQPADHGTVETVPFPGTGAVTKLTQGAIPSWNG